MLFKFCHFLLKKKRSSLVEGAHIVIWERQTSMKCKCTRMSHSDSLTWVLQSAFGSDFIFQLSSAETWPLVAFDTWLKPHSSELPRLSICERPHLKYQEMAVFHRICGSEQRGGGLSGAAAALVYSFVCLNPKKGRRKKRRSYENL